MIGSLFSGYGGLDQAVEDVLDMPMAWYCDNDPDAQAVLRHHAPATPIYGDITDLDWTTLPPVQVLTGGFPCTDVSSAGRRAGLRPGTRSGLWSHMRYGISILRPRLVIVENVRGLLSTGAHGQVEPCPWCVGDRADHCVRALGAVLADLADLGYDAVWCGLRASDVGACHARFRVFIAASPADTEGVGRRERGPEHAGFLGRLGPAVGGDVAADSDGVGRERGGRARGRGSGPADSGVQTAPDTGGAGRRPRSGVSGSGRAAAVGDCAQVAADTAGAGWGFPDHVDRHGTTPVGAGEVELGRRDSDPASVDWGIYEAGIRRWEYLFGRPAPAPTVAGRRGARVLNPAFEEWMMGLPEGHVTGVAGLSRGDQCRLIGNGVMPQQALAALKWLLPRLFSPAATGGDPT